MNTKTEVLLIENSILLLSLALLSFFANVFC